MNGPRNALLAAVLVLLAGCSGLSGPAPGPEGSPTTTPSGTVTPVPVPTDGPSNASLPPGISRSGLTSASVLRDAHRGALEDRSYLEASRTTVRFPNGTVAVEQTLDTRHTRDRSATRLRRNGTERYASGGEPVAAGVWANESYLVQRLVFADGETRHNARRIHGLPDQPRLGYAAALEDTRTAVESQREANGTRETVLVASGLRARGPWYFDENSMELRDRGRARLVVTEAGVLTRFVAEFPARLDGQNVTVRHVYRLTARDVRAPRPPWFEEVPPAETPSPETPVPESETQTATNDSRTVTAVAGDE